MLITRRGWLVLQHADIVVMDELVKPFFWNALPYHTEKVTGDDWRKKIRLAIDAARRGKKVVRLKGGDPTLFAHFREELELLEEADVEARVIPGVTAATAAAADAVVPLTDNELASSVTLVTAVEKKGKASPSVNWGAMVKTGGTVAVYMGVRAAENVTRRLIESGLPPQTPAISVRYAGTPAVRVLDAPISQLPAEMRHSGLKPPVLTLTGPVCNHAAGKKCKRVLFTGLSEERPFVPGERYLHVPMIRILPADDYSELDAAIGRIGCYDWICFTSRYGVRFFFERLISAGKDARCLHGIKIAAIGSSTAAEMERHGLRADMLPEEECSRGLVKAFAGRKERGRVLLPRSDIADKGLTKALEELGYEVDAAVAYRNVLPEHLPPLDPGSFDAIVFTSPSGVRNFITTYGVPPAGVELRFIGEVTRKEYERCSARAG